MPGISSITKLQIIIRITGEEVLTNLIKIITGAKVELVNGDRPNNGEVITTTIRGEMQTSGGNQIKVGWAV